jgi:uncharacterized phage protein (TIGR02218 family)
VKTIGPDLDKSLRQRASLVIVAWTITRTDGQVFAFTSGDVPFTYKGLDFEPTNGFSGTAAASKNNLSVDNVNALGMITAQITERELRTGKFDNAKINIFWIDPTHPEYGEIPIRTGKIGEMKVRNQQFEAEMRSLQQPLQQQFGRVYTLECGWTFGDSRCTFAPASVTGTVTAGAGRVTFYDTSRTEQANFFQYGYVEWLTGENEGFKTEVREYVLLPRPGFRLLEQCPFRIQIGDTYRAVQGCPKTRTFCQSIGNLVNYGGFPDMPTEDKALATPSAKQGTTKQDDGGKG